MSNILTKEEIAELVNHSVVKANQENLSNSNSVSFSIPLSESLKVKLETHFDVVLTQPTIPMRWVKGDTAAHKDRGEKSFEKTCLVYLTDSVGEFIVDGQTYSITAGDAHTFHEGVEHYTMNTVGERLLIGPMSESGFHVGIPSYPVVFFFINDTFVDEKGNPTGFVYIPVTRGPYDGKAIIFNLPPPSPLSNDEYNIQIYDYVQVDPWTPPPGKTFGGWKYWTRDFQGVSPINNDLSHIYMPGEIYDFSAPCILIPNWIDTPMPPVPVPPVPVPPPLNPMRQFIPMHFSNNTVYYKAHSLSVGGGSVRNARHKKRKT